MTKTYPYLTIEHVRDLLKHRESHRDALVTGGDKAVTLVGAVQCVCEMSGPYIN